MANRTVIGLGGFHYDAAFLESVWTELQKKALGWKAGLDAPTPAERLAYDLLKDIDLPLSARIDT